MYSERHHTKLSIVQGRPFLHLVLHHGEQFSSLMAQETNLLVSLI